MKGRPGRADAAGNAESARQVTFSIDTTPPAVSVATSPQVLWPPNGKEVPVTISGSAEDAVSGVASVTIAVQDEYGAYDQLVSAFGSTILLQARRLETDLDGRTYTVSAVAYDVAGNRSGASAVVAVPYR